MKRLFSLGVACLCTALSSFAQGWPANYGGVMLQGFYWDSYTDSKWTKLEAQADELSRYFSLIWVPQSGKAASTTSMGYNPLYYFNQNCSFGTETQLRSMINTFSSKGLGTIADVVINHRGNVSSWVDFPKETYKDVTYEMVATDICKDDDGGATAKANPNVTLSENNDEGTDWSGMRDLDHMSTNVQTCVKAYEDFLHNDLGYIGFRYDMVKGFAGSHIADYNVAAGVQYSVGECWDSNSVIENWINSTKVDGVPQSAAFDFQFRYNVRDAVNNQNWTKLNSTNNLMHDAAYKQFAVTFVENHDVEARETDKQDPIVADTLACNAYLLAMPGTPCVYFKHWQHCKKDIAKMICARKLIGINNQSSYTNKVSNTNYYANEVTGTNGTMIVVVGKTPEAYTNAEYKELVAGKGYRYLVPTSFDTSSFDAEVAYINENVKNSKPAIPSCATVQTGTYAYFEAPSSWGLSATKKVSVWPWNTQNFYSAWPGDNASVTYVGKNNGNPVFLWQYSGDKGTPDKIIFNNGSTSSTVQTADFPFYNGGYYTMRDNCIGIVGQQTAVNEVSESFNPQFSTINRTYNLSGQQVDKNYKGIVIINGKKVMR